MSCPAHLISIWRFCRRGSVWNGTDSLGSRPVRTSSTLVAPSPRRVSRFGVLFWIPVPSSPFPLNPGRLGRGRTLCFLFHRGLFLRRRILVLCVLELLYIYIDVEIEAFDQVRKKFRRSTMLRDRFQSILPGLEYVYQIFDDRESLLVGVSFDERRYDIESRVVLQVCFNRRTKLSFQGIGLCFQCRP